MRNKRKKCPTLLVAVALVYFFSAPFYHPLGGNDAGVEKKIQEAPPQADTLCHIAESWQESKADLLKERLATQMALAELENKEHSKLQNYIYATALSYQENELQAQQTTDAILKWSHLYEIDPLLVLATGIWESKLDPKAVGTSADTGIMQVIPPTGKWIAETLGYDWNYEMLYDIDTNIQFGTYYLRVCFDFWRNKPAFDRGKTALALIGYNRGTVRTLREFESGNQITIYADKVLPIYYRLQYEMSELD